MARVPWRNEAWRWRGGGAKTAHIDARRVPKYAAWMGKSEAEKEEFTTISPNGDGVFRFTKQMDHKNQSIVGEN